MNLTLIIIVIIVDFTNNNIIIKIIRPEFARSKYLFWAFGNKVTVTTVRRKLISPKFK